MKNLDRKIEILENMEVESTSSSEYYDYNYAYKIQSCTVEALKAVYNLFAKNHE